MTRQMVKFPSRLWAVLLCAVTLASCHSTSAPSDRQDVSTSGSQNSTSDQPAEFKDISLRALNQRVPVIMYHDIIRRRGPGSVWFDSTADQFEAQMKEIQDKGYHPVSLDDLYKHLTTGSDLPDHAIVLTFDDNYQGFYDLAWPILKQDNFPAAMFVHTGYVGVTTKSGRGHMSWETLKKLCKDPLFTVGSHTVSHPDLTKIGPIEVTKELTDSKSALEEHLGVTMNYFAYPSGFNDGPVQDAVKDAGYKMAFTMANGPAEESPNILCVNRYVQTRLDKALDDAEQLLSGAVGVYAGAVKDGPVTYSEQEFDGRTLAIITGGRPQSVVSDTREAVIDFMHQNSAVAGINGTFFDMAAIHSTDNKLVGPCKTFDKPSILPDIEPDRWPKIRNRPVIMWGPTSAAIIPYDPPLMNDDARYKDFMPDVTDLFLAGAWLVHDGQPRTEEELRICSSKDVQDPRRRAAFGFMEDGTAFAAAAKDSVSSSQFAEMLSNAKVKEAVLLDSGFSTSLVYGEKIMASGHSTASTPSRPVPHAIVFQGTLDPNSEKAAEAAIPATTQYSDVGEPSYNQAPTGTRHRRRRSPHRRTSARNYPPPDVTITH